MDGEPGVGRAPAPKASRLEKAAWCGFDFANSSFTTVVVTAVYPLYFKRVVFEDAPGGEAAWGFANASSLVLVILTAPIVGAIGDLRARKKLLLLWTTLLCVAATASLSWCGAGAVVGAWTLFVLANLGFSSGENLVAGFLPELASPSEMGRLSGIGWSVGYFGGLGSLVVAFFLDKGGLERWIPLATALFFAAAATPTFLFLRERAIPRAPIGGALREAFSDVRRAYAERARFPDLRRLLQSLFFTQAGVATVITFAGLYAEGEFGMTTRDVALLFVALQLAAAGGAFVAGRIQDRLGSRATLLWSIGAWGLAVLLAVVAPKREVFYVAAALSGAAMGGSQTVGRAMVGVLTPRGSEGRWFALWGVATKAAAVAGLVVFSTLIAHVERRVAMTSLLIFFALGALKLRGVDEARGRSAAEAAGAAP
jgi:MFS transporter, UMF1 family